ncbi:hypothetical protein PRIPAC_80828 [Pristionchus pacificus]|uniref:G protein-coupled receptor n=1 Tax=Pristionchus pacificus TaxID=54126 RepID=A0A2A6C3V5_PRIPA|nr:hypothetical protein PRIPAC_80828 [Pristionchus pacificus]|eukprot:PDM72701.1 G protein-coupled receptor [Pristionchus pacificus]
MFTANDRLHLSIQFIIVTLAVTSNILLLVIIYKRTPAKMRVFSIFLVNNAIVDLISAISGGLACSRNFLQKFLPTTRISDLSMCSTDHSILHFVQLSTLSPIQAVLHNFSSWLLLLTFLFYRMYILRVSQPHRHAKVVIWIMGIVSWAPAVIQIVIQSGNTIRITKF